MFPAWSVSEEWLPFRENLVTFSQASLGLQPNQATPSSIAFPFNWDCRITKHPVLKIVQLPSLREEKSISPALTLPVSSGGSEHVLNLSVRMSFKNPWNHRECTLVGKPFSDSAVRAVEQKHSLPSLSHRRRLCLQGVFLSSCSSGRKPLPGKALWGMGPGGGCRPRAMAKPTLPPEAPKSPNGEP